MNTNPDLKAGTANDLKANPDSSDRVAEYMRRGGTCGTDPNDPTGSTTTCTCKVGSTDCLHMCNILQCPMCELTGKCVFGPSEPASELAK